MYIPGIVNIVDLILTALLLEGVYQVCYLVYVFYSDKENILQSNSDSQDALKALGKNMGFSKDLQTLLQGLTPNQIRGGLYRSYILKRISCNSLRNNLLLFILLGGVPSAMLVMVNNYIGGGISPPMYPIALGVLISIRQFTLLKVLPISYDNHSYISWD